MKNYMKLIATVVLLSAASFTQTRLNINWRAITTPVTYSNLPATPFSGQIAFIIDGNATCTAGGGSTKGELIYNGSGWDVYSCGIGAGTVTTSGSPAATRCAIFSGATAITGTTDCTFASGALSLGVVGGSSGVLNLLGSTSGTASFTSNATGTLVTVGGNFTTFIVPVGTVSAVSIGSAVNSGLYVGAAGSGFGFSNAGTSNFFAGSGSIKASGNVVFNTLSTTGNNTFQGGADGTATSSGTVGGGTFRGADLAAAAVSNSVAGYGIARGGDNAASGAIATAGDMTIRAGQVTSATTTTPNNGRLSIQLVGVKGATYNAGNLACIVASAVTSGYPGTYGDCASAAKNVAFVGVLATANGNSAVVKFEGNATVNSSASSTWTAGDIVCIDGSNAALAIDNGASTACSAGARVGIVSFTDAGNTTAHQVLLVR